MALRFPALVHVKTATTGTGSYNIDESSIPNGKRSMTQATAAGDLADGDTVIFAVVDSTAVNSFEVGRGTWNNTAKTLARTEVYQPGGSAVSWGAGTRDVIICDWTAIATLLVNDQTIAGAKTFSGSLLTAILSGSALGVDSATALLVQRSGVAGDACRLAVIGGSTGVSEVDLGSTSSQFRGRLRYDHSADRLDVYTANALRLQLDGTSLRDGAGVPYEKFPSGGRILWGTNTIPSGWSIVAGLADKTILTTSTASEIDDLGGSWTISGLSTNVAGTALVVDQLPAHTHAIKRDIAAASGSEVRVPDITGAEPVINTESTGAGQTHTHSATTGGDGSWRPSYQKWGAIAKA
jgi:hypothetical protein